MSMKKITAFEYQCDGCGSIQIVADSMDFIGYSGTVLCQSDLGGYSAEWVACRKSCIAKAVPAALERDDR